jgi:TatD DNase family protein
MIDVHCHLEKIENAQEVIDEAKNKMKAVITSCSDIKDKMKVLELVQKNEGFVFATFGLHPENSLDYKKDDIDSYIKWIKKNSDSTAGIGENGLDYFRVKKEKQKETKKVFIKFAELAIELALPLVIHSRSSEEESAFEDIFEILELLAVKNAVLHCFSGSRGNLKHALEKGYWISYATNICKTEKHMKLIKETPLEKMLLETDSPWLHPSKKELINRPWNIEYSAKRIAEIKKIPAEEILKKTEENARKVFRLS